MAEQDPQEGDGPWAYPLLVLWGLLFWGIIIYLLSQLN